MRLALPSTLTSMFGALLLAIQALPAFADPYELLAKYQFGHSREPLAAIEAEIRKTPASEFKNLEKRLLAVLQSPRTTKDAKRSICRWLAVVGSGASVPALAELLTDPELSHPARIALEPNPDPAAGAALRDASKKVQGKLLVGVISSIGSRRDADAVAPLAQLAADHDPAVAEAAILALGQIATAEAAKALETLHVPANLSWTVARARIACANRLAASNKAEAVRIFRSLMDSRNPPATRQAALEGLAANLSASEAAALVAKLIQGNDAKLRAAAITVCAGRGSKDLKNALVAQLPGMAPEAQLALLTAWADDAGVSLRPAALAILAGTKDPRMQSAALASLARHGDPADVAMIVRLARSNQESLADVAHQVLDRMSTPGIDDALVRMLELPDAGDRQVVLTALANRRVAAALPLLVQRLAAPEPGVATMAAQALGTIGTLEQLPPLTAVLVESKSAELQAAAAEAVEKICATLSDKSQAAKALLAALDKASSPAARASLVRLLIHARGQESLAAVLKALRDADETVREAAVRTLVAWPDAAAVPHLLELAKTAQRPAHAVLALRDGCLRLANRKDIPLAERLAIYRGVLETARRVEEKKQAVAGLAELPVLGALELLRDCAKEPALAGDATLASIRLARNLGAMFPDQAKAALEEIKSRAASDEIKKSAEEALASLKNWGLSPDGFILAWLLSGPYAADGKDGAALFDVAFAPEKPGAKVDWQPAILSPGRGPRLIEIDKILGGNDRACYLRTRIESNREQDALLEIGSDDGVKVWLNTQVVHANNVVRPCTPDQDKIKVRLRQGANVLLIKVTQKGGQWSLCCRLRAPDGTTLVGVVVSPGEL